MSLAVGALLVAILLLPGIVFRYLYIRSDALRKTIDLSLLNEAVFILGPSLLLHLFGLVLLDALAGYRPHVEQLYLLISGQGAERLEFDTISAGFPTFVVYILALCVVAGFMGISLQKLVVRYGWDERYKILRIYNDWDKYFSGHVLPPAEREQIDFVQVDVVVNTADGDVLYTGILENYTLNKDQGIDRVFMSHVHRRAFRDDAAPDGPLRARAVDDRYYELPGNFFVVPFSEIRNLNIIYNTLEEAGDGAQVQK